MSLMDHYREDTNDIPCRATHCTHTKVSEEPKYCPCCAGVMFQYHINSSVMICKPCKKEFFIRRIV